MSDSSGPTQWQLDNAGRVKKAFDEKDALARPAEGDTKPPPGGAKGEGQPSPQKPPAPSLTPRGALRGQSDQAVNSENLRRDLTRQEALKETAAKAVADLKARGNNKDLVKSKDKENDHEK